MTPDGDSRDRLTALRNGLLRLHSALLASERSQYERDIERIPSQGRFLELLLNDPAFTWLRELSQLVVFIDERLEAEDPPDRAEADRLVARARQMLTPGQTGTAFETRYLEALQRDPNVVMAHSTALTLLRGLG
ncbi:MAG: hypothetical protein ACM336_20735 [Acidobacteriota bacterium]